jgi:hypothetical protein
MPKFEIVPKFKSVDRRWLERGDASWEEKIWGILLQNSHPNEALNSDDNRNAFLSTIEWWGVSHKWQALETTLDPRYCDNRRMWRLFREKVRPIEVVNKLSNFQKLEKVLKALNISSDYRPDDATECLKTMRHIMMERAREGRNTPRSPRFDTLNLAYKYLFDHLVVYKTGPRLPCYGPDSDSDFSSSSDSGSDFSFSSDPDSD